MRFLDVKTDFAFKKVFGSQQSKPVLVDFLNAMLDYSGEFAIADLEIVDPYQIPLIKGMKDTFVDVKAVLANGSRVIIEMQVLNIEGFEQRILYNAAKQYSSQLLKGEHYRLLNPVIALTFTDFILFKEAPEQVISRFRLIEYGDDIELVFVELPNFSAARISSTTSSSNGFTSSKTRANSTSFRKASTPRAFARLLRSSTKRACVPKN